MATSHTWNFFRAGGLDQVQLDSGADLLALKELDQKLWVDADGHVRANEVLAAIDWAGRLLKNADLRRWKAARPRSRHPSVAATVDSA